MPRISRLLVLLPLILGAPAAALSDSGEAASPAEALTGGSLLLNLRPRYERVEQDGRQVDANALTLRSLLGWKTGSYRGFGATVQIIDVGRANDNYNDTRNGKTAYPVVADPDNTDVNQMFLDYTGLPDTRLRLGRQSIKLDNVRFVGNVEFRQVMQVFNGATVENTSLPGTALYAGHLERLKTVFGDQQEIRLEVLHVAHEWSPGQSLVGYGYFHDSPKTASATGFADNSNRIIGIRADGAQPFGAANKLLYTLEYARQRPYADGDARIDADYLRAGAGLGRDAFLVRVDYEKLGSNDGLYGFQTPLGTNHLFQGWADLFLTTPRQGIRDLYLTAAGSVGKAKWAAEFHDFDADHGDLHYGRELDLSLTYPLRKGLSGKIEVARFREDEILASARKPDTDKVWFTLTYSVN